MREDLLHQKRTIEDKLNKLGVLVPLKSLNKEIKQLEQVH